VRSRKPWTDADHARLVAEYDEWAARGQVQELATQMGRTRQFLARKAREAGLTDPTRKKPFLGPAISKRQREKIARDGHPRGFLGRSHSAATREVCSNASRQMWGALDEAARAELVTKMRQGAIAAGTTTAPNRAAASWKAGWREIGGQRCYFRSAWEANYARYLDWLRERGEITEWKHEPETFWFEKIKRGVRSYKPDFRVVEKSGVVRFHEVKGWMDDRSRVCLKRMAKYHPSVTIVLVDSKSYRSIARQMAPIIAGWETRNDKKLPPIGRAPGWTKGSARMETTS